MSTFVVRYYMLWLRFVVLTVVDNGGSFAVLQDGVTPLHMAAWLGFADISQILVEAGADTLAVDEVNV
jgi:hypothetical protein